MNRYRRSQSVLAHYKRQRRADVTGRAIAVRITGNRTWLTDFYIPVHGARGLSLNLVDRIGGPLRRAKMREEWRQPSRGHV